MNRIDRLTAIIIFLQGRKYVTVRKLSERYEISERTVYRDLAALQEAGVPLGSEPGRGYFIVKGYHLPPVRFSRREASSLLAGERMIQKWDQTELGKSYLSALDKIRSILPADDKDYFETLDKRIQAFHYRNDKQPQPDEQIFSSLQNAIFKNELIEMRYKSPYTREETRRKVEPLGLLFMDNHWYLAAWCRLRTDYRMFRLDRFLSYKSTGDLLPDPPEHTLKEFHDNSLDEEKELREVTVWFKEDMVRYIGDQKFRYGWAWEEKMNDGLKMTFLTSHPEYLTRWVLIWGNGAKVLAPEEVKNQVKKLVGELYEHYLQK